MISSLLAVLCSLYYLLRIDIIQGYNILKPFNFNSIGHLEKNSLLLSFQSIQPNDYQSVSSGLSIMSLIWYNAVQYELNPDEGLLFRKVVNPYLTPQILCDYLCLCQKSGALHKSIISFDNEYLSIKTPPIKINKKETGHNFGFEAHQILSDTKSFVKAMISDFFICPFTNGAEKAGVPRGNIRYAISKATTINEAYYDYWNEVEILLSANVKDISTVLLVYPYLFTDFSRYSEFTDSLDTALSDETSSGKDFQFSTCINNVYFHPDFKFYDKEAQVVVVFDENGDVIGTSDEIVSPISYARRSPYPIVNILRSGMVKASQKNIPEGKIFNANKIRLESVGSDVLQDMLNRRDWSQLPVVSPAAAIGVISKVKYDELQALSNNEETSDNNNNNNNKQKITNHIIVEEDVTLLCDNNNTNNNDDDDLDYLLTIADNWLSTDPSE
eukprot:gene8988-12123_t